MTAKLKPNPRGLAQMQTYDGADFDQSWIEVPIIRETECSVSALSVTWQTLVLFRDIALQNNDFERAVGYSHVIDDMAQLITAQGVELPPKPPED